MKRFLSAALFLLILAGCATAPANVPVRDLTILPQDAGVYHGLEPDTPLLPPGVQREAYEHFLSAHFAPWSETASPLAADTVFWGLTYYAGKQLFAENTLPRDPSWMRRMRMLSRVEDYPSMNRRAIAVVNTPMRVLPTATPAFYDPAQPGEGFPFDYMQNSLVLAGTPLRATHTSADRQWILVESRFAYGWVRSVDIAWVDAPFASLFRTGSYAAITRDQVPLSDLDGTFRCMGEVGMVLPILEGGVGGNGYASIVPVRGPSGNAIPQVVFLSGEAASLMPIPATPANFARIANAMMQRPYGWGGLYENRDCSAATMDLMAGFGIFLPRNSSQQIGVGTFASLDTLDRSRKKAFILAHATPFLTLIRKPGHIMLYVGQRSGQPIVFHVPWGLKTGSKGNYGRKIIGKAAITTLEPGLEMPSLARPEGILLETVSGMTVLPGNADR